MRFHMDMRTTVMCCADPSRVDVMVINNTARGNGNNSAQQGGGMIHHSDVQGHVLPSTAASVRAFLIDKITLKAVYKEKKAFSKIFS